MRFVLIVLMTVFAVGEAMAETSREEKIAYIVETENFRDEIVTYKKELIKGAIIKANANANMDLDQKQIDIISEELENIVEEYVDDYMREIIDLYSSYFTDDEVNAFYNFYRSPEGISIGGKYPEISRKLFWIDARYLELLSEQAVPRITERLSREGQN